MNKRRSTARQRAIIWQRARGCCEYCRSQERFADYSYSVEHIIPWSKGGKTELDNLALSCQGCNGHKGIAIEGHDPQSGEITPIFHPRKHSWSDHFAWNDDCSLIVGVTAIGRATVAVLQLNRAGLINLRRELYRSGNHSPAEFDEQQ